ncbi:MAG: hypothetical protein AAB699_02580 [Patescibacteria group bacterium]
MASRTPTAFGADIKYDACSPDIAVCAVKELRLRRVVSELTHKRQVPEPSKVRLVTAERADEPLDCIRVALNRFF